MTIYAKSHIFLALKKVKNVEVTSLNQFCCPSRNYQAIYILINN